jgi:hypothetical protein
MCSFIHEESPPAPRTQIRGSRLHYTTDLPAALACDGDVVEGAPVAVVVGARKDCLAARETVLSVMLVMTPAHKQNWKMRA